ncbi:hypothetical protein Pfo_022745 [Paulownia fortunei]|nr:hypothetical protein Pfo_022745 [Paulownia fortunei]
MNPSLISVGQAFLWLLLIMRTGIRIPLRPSANFVFTLLTSMISVTLGEEGSGFSKAPPLFLPVVVKKGDACPPLRLPLVRRRRLRKEREMGPPFLVARMGLRIDLVSFMEEEEEEEEERREVKQMKRSLVVVAALVALHLPVLVVRKWGVSKSILSVVVTAVVCLPWMIWV